jgi:hypothetical protein
MPYLHMLLRPAAPDDAIAVARVHVRSWQAAYRTLLPDDYLDQLRPEDRAQKYDFASLDPLKPRTIVAAEEGLIHGFATAGLPPRRHRANQICRTMESCVRSMWIPNSGAGVLEWPLFRPLVLASSDSDFECGSMGPSGQRSCGALLSNRSVGRRWPAPNRLVVGCNGQRSPLSAQT